MTRARNEHLTESIRERREARGWSVAMLATAAGVSPGTVQNAEAGLLPNTSNLQSIARALNTSVGVLLGETDETGVPVGVAIPGWNNIEESDREHVRYMVTRLGIAQSAHALALAQYVPDDPEVQRAASRGVLAVAPEPPAIDLGDLSEEEREVVLSVSSASQKVVADAFRRLHARQHEGEVGAGRPAREHAIPRTTRPRQA
ncbi:MAG: helix-turn-helix domain-containing protein [Dehalococcoidia bacterium]